MTTIFSTTTPFEKRLAESQHLQAKYPDRLPVIVDQIAKSTLPPLDKNKYLVPSDLTFGQFAYVLRKRLILSAEKALFLFINGTLVTNTELMSQVAKNHKNKDGFLYVTVSEENTFG